MGSHLLYVRPINGEPIIGPFSCFINMNSEQWCLVCPQPWSEWDSRVLRSSLHSQIYMVT